MLLLFILIDLAAGALQAGTPTLVHGTDACYAADGYTCYSGFCASDSFDHPKPPQCGPELEEIPILKGVTWAKQVASAGKWCTDNLKCHGFAIDPSNSKWLAFASANFTAAAQPNSAWTAWWAGSPQPIPPAPAPAPPPPPPAPAPWVPILPKGPCKTDEDCSLNGVCSGSSNACVCYDSWTGHNCEKLRLLPVPPVAGYGMSPNITSWGASIIDIATIPTAAAATKSVAGSGSSSSSSSSSSKSRGGSTGNATKRYHMYVTEETDGKGLNSWITNSRIVHAVSDSPFGPFVRKDVVSPTPTTNPQILYDPHSETYLLFHIRGASSFGLFTSATSNGGGVDGPWVPTDFALGACNNPTATFHPTNASLYVMCHDAHFSMYRFDPAPRSAANAGGGDGNGSGKWIPAWKAKPAPPIATLGPDNHKNLPGANCEDPFIYFDRNQHFHVIAHCYTCYWYPAAHRPGKPDPGRQGGCLPNAAFCAGHGFSRTGEAGDWTWIGGPDAPYNFTSVEADGVTLRNFSTRERPWALLGGGQYGDEFVALINGVSPSMPAYNKFTAGQDWTYTNVQPVGGS